MQNLNKINLTCFINNLNFNSIMKKNEKCNLFLAKVMAFFAPKYCIKHKTLKSNPCGRQYLPSLSEQRKMIKELSNAEISERYWSWEILGEIFDKNIFPTQLDSTEFHILSLNLKHVRMALLDSNVEFTNKQIEDIVKNYGIPQILTFGKVELVKFLEQKIETGDYRYILDLYNIPELNELFKLAIDRVGKGIGNPSQAINEMITHLFKKQPTAFANDYNCGPLYGYYNSRLAIHDQAIWLSLAMKYVNISQEVRDCRDSKEVYDVLKLHMSNILEYLKNSKCWTSNFLDAVAKCSYCDNEMFMMVYQNYPCDDATKDKILFSLIRSCNLVEQLAKVYEALPSNAASRAQAVKLLTERSLAFLSVRCNRKYVYSIAERDLVVVLLNDKDCPNDLKKEIVLALTAGKSLSENLFKRLSEELQQIAQYDMEMWSQVDMIHASNPLLNNGDIKLFPEVEVLLFSWPKYMDYWRPYITKQELSIEGLISLLNIGSEADDVEALLELYLSKTNITERVYRLLMSSSYSYLAPKYKGKVGMK